MASNVYKDWSAVTSKAYAGDRFPPELPSDTKTKTKSKVSQGKERMHQGYAANVRELLYPMPLTKKTGRGTSPVKARVVMTRIIVLF
jgi:hypothetical protein